MAIAGSGGWIPSNYARLRNGQLEFTGITQNKPRYILPPLDEAARLLLAGETVTVDMRYQATSQLRALLEVT
jgi:hypothetical protein